MCKSEDNKNQLIEHLYAVLNTEMEKPYAEIDTDFIEACVELILELQEKNFTLSNEEIENLVRKIPFVDAVDFIPSQQKKIKKRKILLIAAIIAILSTLLAVITSGRFIDYWHRVMNDKFGSVFNVPIGEEYVDGNDEFGYLGESVIYTDLNDFYKKEQLDVLIPSSLPNEINIVAILVTEFDNSVLVSFDSIITSYEIHLNTEIPEAIPLNLQKVHTKNNLICYVDKLEGTDTIQIYFEHNGNYYIIGGTNEQILLNIIENLEEY